MRTGGSAGSGRGRPLGERRARAAQAPEGPQPLERQPRVGQRAPVGVGDDAADPERPAAGTGREPGRLHVDREREPVELMALCRAEDPAGRGERADVHAEAAPPKRRGEEQAARHLDANPALVDELARADDIARSQGRIDPGTEAGDRDGGRAVGERAGSGDPGPPGPHPRLDDRGAGRRPERVPLDPERHEDEERLAHRACPTTRPSAITGKTSR